MQYIASKSVGIKRNQDKSDYTDCMLVLCDGIGEFDNSQDAAGIVVKYFAINKPTDFEGIIETINQIQKEIKSEGIEGGTTLIYSILNEKTLTFAYLGNGAIIQTTGDFAKVPNTFQKVHSTYRFVNLFLPHIDEYGTLTRHISHISSENELRPDIITLNSERPEGLIYIILSDGITSLEEQVIISDTQGRKWRSESSLTVKILERLHKFLELNFDSFNSNLLKEFIEETLDEFKLGKELEDDASLGIIISENVINYYKKGYKE